jgi:hypothetical protein
MQLHYTDRDLALIYIGTPSHKPILTLENYCKWYRFYALMPDGTVRKVESSEYYDDLDYNGTIWYDHVPNPEVYELIANHLNMFQHSETHEMIIGRYYKDIMWQY